MKLGNLCRFIEVLVSYRFFEILQNSFAEFFCFAFVFVLTRAQLCNSNRTYQNKASKNYHALSGLPR